VPDWNLPPVGDSVGVRIDRGVSGSESDPNAEIYAEGTEAAVSFETHRIEARLKKPCARCRERMDELESSALSKEILVEEHFERVIDQSVHVEAGLPVTFR
jgi:cytidine deaminase